MAFSVCTENPRECQVICIERLPYFIKITYAETLSDKSLTGTTNRNRIWLENVLPTIAIVLIARGTTSESTKV